MKILKGSFQLISNDEIVFTDSSLLYARKDSMRDILGARGTGRYWGFEFVKDAD